MAMSAPDKREYRLNIFLISIYENIMLWVLTEAPQQGASYEYLNIFFHAEIRISVLFG